MPLKDESGRIKELERIMGMKDDNSFDKAHQLRDLAILLSRTGKNEESSRVLDLASEEIVNGAPNDEKPRELCEIARRFSEIGRRDKAESAIKKAMEILEFVKRTSHENQWKFTNHLCCVAYESLRLGSEDALVRGLLERAIGSLGDIDAYHLRRKSEILSYLKGFSEDKNLMSHLQFNSTWEPLAESQPRIPFGLDFENLCSHIFLNEEIIEELKSMAEKNLGKEELSKAVSSINERWRQSIALTILSTLFLKKSDVKKSLEILDLAVREARNIQFYWVRDNALEDISETFLKIYHMSGDNTHHHNAKDIAYLMRDPWKKARAICRIAKTHVGEKRFEQAAQELNYVYSHLLDRIDYRDRTAMSMLLIAEVFDILGEKRPTALFRIFNPDRRRAQRLRRDAFSILDSFAPDKRKESLEEYEGFISLRKHAC